MRFLLPILVIVWSLLALPAIAHSEERLPEAAINSCEGTLQTEQGSNSETTISLLWFPLNPTATGLFTHAKLELDGRVFSTLSSISKHASMEAMVWSANHKTEHAFVRFKYKLNKEEAQTLAKAIEGRITGQTCSFGACSVINESGAFYIPPGIRTLPYVAALYLTVTQLIHLNEDVQIEFVGRRKAIAGSALSMPLWLSFETVMGASMVGMDLFVSAKNASKANLRRVWDSLRTLGMRTSRTAEPSLGNAMNPASK